MNEKNLNCCTTKRTERDEQMKKNLNIRLNKIAGQIEGVKKMIDEDRYCDDVLIQISSIRASLASTADLLLENHISSCVIDRLKKGDDEIMDELLTLLKRIR
ncbi:MAG: metal-sensing transcriptional repressor [Mycoplasmatales bacterium]